MSDELRFNGFLSTLGSMCDSKFSIELLCRWLGVEKMYLMENVETPTEYLVQQIQDFIEQGVVEYMNNGTITYQARWYYDCMKLNQHKQNWHAFLPPHVLIG
jgi:hypothetical protein